MASHSAFTGASEIGGLDTVTNSAQNATSRSRYAESPTHKLCAIVLRAVSQGVTVRILLFVTLFEVADMLTVAVVDT
jgi:hypothetical protein